MIDPSSAIPLSQDAGQAIMQFYRRSADVEIKDDGSPLTRGDRASHEVLVEGLRKQFPKIPVVSEEDDDHATTADERRGWRQFWLIDPLDGTKEFIKETGYFTVNVALVEDGVPVWGVVHAPAAGLTYWGGAATGSWKQDSEDAEPVRISCAPFPDVALRADATGSEPAPSQARLRVVASRDHAGPEVGALLARFPNSECLSIGSSLKFCLVAEGAADIYLRDVPTMEWDTAAAHAVVLGAGGRVETWDDRQTLCYNKPTLRNPAIVCLGAANRSADGTGR